VLRRDNPSQRKNKVENDLARLAPHIGGRPPEQHKQNAYSTQGRQGAVRHALFSPGEKAIFWEELNFPEADEGCNDEELDQDRKYIHLSSVTVFELYQL